MARISFQKSHPPRPMTTTHWTTAHTFEATSSASDATKTRNASSASKPSTAQYRAFHIPHAARNKTAAIISAPTSEPRSAKRASEK